MFEAGFVIPQQAEWLVSHSASSTFNDTRVDNSSSYLGTFLRRQFTNSPVISGASGAFSRREVPSLLALLCILPICLSIICLGPLIQTVLSFSRCNRCPKSVRSTNHKRHPHITIGLVLFVFTWLLIGVALVVFVIFLSENLHLVHSTTQERYGGFFDRVDNVAIRTFDLMRILTNETVPVVNDTINAIMGDLYVSVIDEVPTITNQFLKLTDLDTPLAMLGNLAKTVEDLLSAHIYLRENGPHVAIELGKLDSIIRVNGEILLNERRRTIQSCADSLHDLPSLESFGMALEEAANGLLDIVHNRETFFNLFRLEGSLGLFNMLNVLPFNISEVTDQLKSAMMVRGELEDSIRNKTARWFSGMSNQTDPQLIWLSPYTKIAFDKIDDASTWYHGVVKGTKPTARRLERLWIIVYFLGALALATPAVLLICSCLQPVKSKKTIQVPKEVYPLLITSAVGDAASTVSSGRGSVTEGDISSLALPATTSPESPLMHDPTISSGIGSFGIPAAAAEDLLQRSRSNSVGSDSGCPRNDSRLAKEKPSSWARADTLDSMASETTVIGRFCCCSSYLGSSSRQRRCKGWAHLTSCCGLLFLAIFSGVLVIGVGFFHVRICLPLTPNSRQQFQLDSEINDIINNNWDAWMQQLDITAQQYLQLQTNSSSDSFNLQNILTINRPRNLVSAAQERCLTVDNESIFDAVSFGVKLNLTGILQVPIVRNYSNQFRVSFAEQAVLLMIEKLDNGILPPNFELLLQGLKAEPATKEDGGVEDSGGASVLDTADRFWSQAIFGAAEREGAMNTTVVNLQRNRNLMKLLSNLRKNLEAELRTAQEKLTSSCAADLASLLQASQYSLRIIRLSRKKFSFLEKIKKLTEAAVTLHRISKQPSFTKTLSTFADLAFDMGLSKASSSSSRKKLLASVDHVISLEYDRLAIKFESGLAAQILNAHIAAALGRFTAPCRRLSVIAQDAVGTTCLLRQPKWEGGVVGRQSIYVPLIQRISAIGFTLVIFITFCTTLFFLHLCITRWLSNRRRKTS